MSTRYIYFQLYRSNPIIIRYVALPENFPLAELPELCCLVFGLERSDYYCEVCPDPIPGSESAPGIELFSEMTGVIHLAKDQQTAKLLSLDFYFGISEEKDDPVSIPALREGTGCQLPSGVLNISVINEMQAELSRYGVCHLPSGEILYREQQELNFKKTGNAICKRYAPDQAQAELRMDLGIPLIDMLDSITLTEIKEIMDSYHVYIPAGQKKVYYVAVLNEKLEMVNPDAIFGQMEMREYLNFRQLALSGVSSCENNEDVAREFPVLWSDCRIRFVKKQGIRISREILQAYEEWFSSPLERKFCINKMIRSAMRWCGFYYGIFSVEDCRRVLDAVYPGQIKKEDLEAYWEETPGFADPENLAFTGKAGRTHSLNDYAYDTRVIAEKEKEFFLEAVRNDLSERKLPDDAENFEKTAAYSVFSVVEVKKYRNLLAGFYYYDTEKAESVIRQGIQMIRCGVPAEEADEKAIKQIYWGYIGANKADAFKQYLKSVEDMIPQFLYYGFNKAEIRTMSIRSSFKDRLQELKLEEEEKKKEAARLKREAAIAAKAAEKKKTGTAARKTSAKRTNR